MKRRMYRLFRPDARILIVAMDHTAFMDEPVDGLVRYADTVRTAVAAGADAFLSPVGSIQNNADAYGPAAAIASVDTADPFLETAVERALAVGADAVKCMVYPFSDADSVTRTYRLANDAAKVGLPLVAEPVPGGFSNTEMRTPEIIAAGARIAGESGADVVKTFYTGDPETMKLVVDYAGVPVVILGGAQKGSLRDLFQVVYDAVIVAGCAGVAIGNNIWRAVDPGAVVRGLTGIIHGGLDVDGALAAAGDPVGDSRSRSGSQSDAA